MYYEMESCRCIRTEKWKYIARRSPNGPGELYDMQADPHERFNLFGQAALAATQNQLAEKLNQWFNTYASPEYDIWNGGHSKARRHHAPKGHPDYRPR